MLGYLDPGAGSSIAAAVASGAVGAGVAWRVIRHRVGAKLRRTPSAAPEPGNDAHGAERR